MKCPRCGAPSEVRETRDASLFTTRRRRECLNGHRFTTVEMHQAAACSAKQRLAALAQTIQRRAAQWQRDRAIALQLHRGWRALADQYGLTKGAIYQAAARGRTTRGG